MKELTRYMLKTNNIVINIVLCDSLGLGSWEMKVQSPFTNDVQMFDKNFQVKPEKA